MHHLIEPPPRLHIIKPSNNHRELPIEAPWFVLDFACVRDDFDSLYPLHYELGCDFGLVSADVLVPEEELAVEVGEVDGVEVDYVDLGEAREGEVLDDLAAQAAGADDQHFEVH